MAQSSKLKVVNYSFRIQQDLYDYLEKHAKRNYLSINSALNLIVEDYIHKEKLKKINSIYLPLDILQGLFECADKSALKDCAAKLGKTNGEEYLEILYNQTSKSTVLNFLETWLRQFNGFEHRRDEYMHILIVPHNVNENCSIFLQEYIKAFIEVALGEIVHISTTKRMIKISLSD